MSAEAEATIRKLEEARCLALTSADYAALSDLVADDLVHVHASGLSEGKAAYLAGIAEKLEFLSVARPDLKVRVYDGVAIATGPDGADRAHQGQWRNGGYAGAGHDRLAPGRREVADLQLSGHERRRSLIFSNPV